MPLTFQDLTDTGDLGCLNLALLLESAQRQLYDDALLRLTTGGESGAGTSIAGLNLSEKTPEVICIAMIRKIEHDHRDLLAITLGTAAIEVPAFNFNLESKSREDTLESLLAMERTASRGYLGIIGGLATPKHAAMLVAIQGTESRHVAIVSSLIHSVLKIQKPPVSTDEQGREIALSPEDLLKSLSSYFVV